jgi:hypothetical protein
MIFMMGTAYYRQHLTLAYGTFHLPSQHRASFGTASGQGMGEACRYPNSNFIPNTVLLYYFSVKQ